MSTEKLINEMSDLRRYVNKPKLIGRDWASALTLSTVGVGSTVSFLAGYFHHLTQNDNTPFSEKLKEVYANRGEGFMNFMQKEENKNFRTNLAVTAVTFIVTSLASLGYFLGIQKQARARESAIKLEYVSRVLKERGYVEDVQNHTFYLTAEEESLESQEFESDINPEVSEVQHNTEVEAVEEEEEEVVERAAMEPSPTGFLNRLQQSPSTIQQPLRY